MLKVKTDGTTVWFGSRFSLTFHRTLRIPDDGNTYPLPPGLGSFPICHVSDFKNKVPKEWAKRGGVFIPMYQREALWISFHGAYWKPNAVKIGIGKINAVSGKPWNQTIRKQKQDYLVCPPQPWLDGINAGKGYIRQFVAMPLGEGYTVESQLTGKEEWGGIQILVFEPKPGIFPSRPPKREVLFSVDATSINGFVSSMGLAAGGKMKQEIYPDPHGFETWDPKNYGRLYIHIVNSEMYKSITGIAPPPTPISAKMYTQYGLPWFELYGGDLGDLPVPKDLKGIKSVSEIDKEKSVSSAEDEPVTIPPEAVVPLWVEGGKIQKRREILPGRSSD